MTSRYLFFASKFKLINENIGVSFCLVNEHGFLYDFVIINPSRHLVNTMKIQYDK